MINSLDSLAEYMGATAPTECSLSRRLYKDTKCGAWLKAMTQLSQKHMATTAKTYPRKPSAEPDGDTVSLDVSDLLVMLKEMEKQAVLMRMQSQMLSDDHEKQRCIDEASGMLKVLAALRYRYHAQFEKAVKSEES